LYTTQHISQIINANLVGNQNNTIHYLLTDSRQLTEPAHSVFIALTSDRNDAHQYIYSLHQKGVKTFIVTHVPEKCIGLEDVCFLIVKDTLKACLLLVLLAAMEKPSLKNGCINY
jgi:alanine racemase